MRFFRRTAALSLLCLALSIPAEAQKLRAGFLALDTVFNSELMAPYDILHHSVFRDNVNYIEPFVVSPDGEPVVTFEGLTIEAHHSFDTAPEIDILVIPSTNHSMSLDLENERLMAWLRSAVESADWVITLCDGAFPLAATGVLDDRHATTFPGDRERFAEMFPNVKVDFESLFVVDGRFITSAGGARSYEPALYLLEHLYGKPHADRTAQGMVIDWDLASVPHRVYGDQ